MAPTNVAADATPRERHFGLLAVDTTQPTADDYRRLAREIDEALIRHDISPWFPRCIDHVNGGFTSGYTNTWEAFPAQLKAIVFQSRMTWFTAQVSERMTGADAQRFRDYSLHGVKCLRDTLWDSKNGGFFWHRNHDGSRPPASAGQKFTYGIAFGIYGCANAHRVTGDTGALELAQRTFRWLDERAHDSANGGYYEALDDTGTPLLQGPRQPIPKGSHRHYGYKSMNTHIHVLEAFSELYRVWPDPALRVRLQEMLHIVRDIMFVPPGCLNQFYTPDYRPLPDLDSYGHDVETGYLLVEAAQVLSQSNDAITWERARALVDNALEKAFDGNLGGLYDEGPVFGKATILYKIWWIQAEALNAFYLMHEKFGDTDLRYWTAFTRTWDFITSHQHDNTHGGWHDIIGLDDKPILRTKGNDWKEAYHTSRALLNVSKGLRHLAQEKAPPLELP